MKRVVIINVTEGNVADGDDPYVTSLLLETEKSNETIESAISMINIVKESADDGDTSMYGFEIPEDWEDLGWDEKVAETFKYVVKKYELGVVLPAFTFDTTVS